MDYSQLLFKFPPLLTLTLAAIGSLSVLRFTASFAGKILRLCCKGVLFVGIILFLIQTQVSELSENQIKDLKHRAYATLSHASQGLHFAFNIIKNSGWGEELEHLHYVSEATEEHR